MQDSSAGLDIARLVLMTGSYLASGAMAPRNLLQEPRHEKVCSMLVHYLAAAAAAEEGTRWTAHAPVLVAEEAAAQASPGSDG